MPPGSLDGGCAKESNTRDSCNIPAPFVRAAWGTVGGTLFKAGEGGGHIPRGDIIDRGGRKLASLSGQARKGLLMDSSAEWVQFCLFRGWIEVGP